MRRLTRAIKIGIWIAVILGGVVACQNYRQSQGPELRVPADGVVRLASYNVHYINMLTDQGRWSPQGWDARKEPLAAAVGAMAADIIAFQEMETFTGGNSDEQNLARSYLLERHPEYDVAAIGDWRSFPSTQPIFYRKTRFDVLDEGWFFFSDTPDVIYSRTFNGSYPAFASWVEFSDRRSQRQFKVLNLHTDYSSSENRERSIELVASRIGPWIRAGETVFVVGDLNARLDSPLHQRLEEVGLAFVPVQGATYHFDIGLNLFGAIDHIGYFQATLDREPIVLREKFGSVWPTDHYPLIADFTFDQ